MTNLPVYNREGEVVSEVEISDAIFMNQINVPLMHQAVRVWLNGQRSGTHATKNRGMVRGGGKKPWRQKGTGRASFGSSRNPVWRGGGVAFGPSPRSYEIAMPKKMKRKALLSALSAKVAENNLIILEELNFEAPKTREMARLLNNLKALNALIVLELDNNFAALSARNLPKVNVEYSNSLNTYKVLYNEKMVITLDALNSLEEVLA